MRSDELPTRVWLSPLAVFFYYGLDTVRSAEDIRAAGPHVRDTAVGVLMLDKCANRSLDCRVPTVPC